MAKLKFYRQRRVDGGTRTGIDSENEELWRRFDEPDESEADPALLWYVDVRCHGSAVPTGREETRAWLLQQAPTIMEAFNQVADKLHAGYDGPWPYVFPVPDGPPGATIKIVCSSIRGLEVGELSKVLRSTGRRWSRLLKQLEPAESLTGDWPART
jgi:hypothetical protein